MTLRIQPRALARFVRADLPRPLDVLNLIEMDRPASYRWYAVLVAPALRAVGGRPRWLGRLARHLHGPAAADTLLVVRYPSHRHFVAMTTNPYYFAINRFRERGVARFEAGFTHPSRTAADLRRRELVLVAQFARPDGLAAVEEILAPAVGELVYAARESSRARYLRDPRPTDPAPPRFPHVAFFAAPSADLALAPELLERLDAATGGASLSLFRREPAREYVPPVLRRLLRS